MTKGITLKDLSAGTRIKTLQWGIVTIRAIQIGVSGTIVHLWFEGYCEPAVYRTNHSWQKVL